MSNSLGPQWTVAYQAPPSIGFSRQEYWNGLPLPSPGDLPNPGIEPRSPALQADALTSELLLLLLSHFSRARFCATPKMAAHQVPPSTGIIQGRILEWIACPLSGDLPNPVIKPRFSALQADSLPSEPPGKPKNTGVSSLALLQVNLPDPGITGIS